MKDYFVILFISILCFIVNDALQFNVGVVHSVQNMVWQNARHAIDEWNNANIAGGFTLNLIAPTDSFASADARFCDVAQRQLIALIVPIACALPTLNQNVNNGETNDLSRDDILLVLSMCNRFKLPCIVDKHINSFSDTEYVFNVGLDANVIGKALSQLISKLLWNSFLLIYRRPEDVAEITDLLSVYHSLNGARTSVKMLRLPADVKFYDAFLKHIREHIRITNIDLRILEDFFAGLDNAYHCNISGIQLVQTKPPFFLKTDMALAFNSVNFLGSTLKILYEKQLILKPQSLICDAGVAWQGGNFFSDALREEMIPIPQSDLLNFETTNRATIDETFDDFTTISAKNMVPNKKYNKSHNYSTISVISRSVNERFIEL